MSRSLRRDVTRTLRTWFTLITSGTRPTRLTEKRNRKNHHHLCTSLLDMTGTKYSWNTLTPVKITWIMSFRMHRSCRRQNWFKKKANRKTHLPPNYWVIDLKSPLTVLQLRLVRLGLVNSWRQRKKSRRKRLWVRIARISREVLFSIKSTTVGSITMSLSRWRRFSRLRVPSALFRL